MKTIALIGILIILALCVYVCYLIMIDRHKIRMKAYGRNFECNMSVIEEAIANLPVTDSCRGFIQEMFIGLEDNFMKDYGRISRARRAFEDKYFGKESRPVKFENYNDEEVDLGFMSGLV